MVLLKGMKVQSEMEGLLRSVCLREPCEDRLGTLSQHAASTAETFTSGQQNANPKNEGLTPDFRSHFVCLTSKLAWPKGEARRAQVQHLVGWRTSERRQTQIGALGNEGVLVSLTQAYTREPYSTRRIPSQSSRKSFSSLVRASKSLLDFIKSLARISILVNASPSLSFSRSRS